MMQHVEHVKKAQYTIPEHNITDNMMQYPFRAQDPKSGMASGGISSMPRMSMKEPRFSDGLIGFTLSQLGHCQIDEGSWFAFALHTLKDKQDSLSIRLRI